MHFEIDSRTRHRFNFHLIQGLVHVQSNTDPLVLIFADVPDALAQSLKAELDAKKVPYKTSVGVNGTWKAYNGATWHS